MSIFIFTSVLTFCYMFVLTSWGPLRGWWGTCSWRAPPPASAACGPPPPPTAPGPGSAPGEGPRARTGQAGGVCAREKRKTICKTLLITERERVATPNVPRRPVTRGIAEQRHGSVPALYLDKKVWAYVTVGKCMNCFRLPYNKIPVEEGLLGRQCLEGVNSNVHGGGGGGGWGWARAGLTESGDLGGSAPLIGFRFCWCLILKQ